MPNTIREKEIFYEVEHYEPYHKERPSKTIFETELKNFIKHYRDKNWPDELIRAILEKTFKEMK